MPFQPASYGDTCARLLGAAALSPLGPGEPDELQRALLESLDDQQLFPGVTVVDRSMADCCRSALWLLHNFLDESHRISQEIETRTGSYWHGIMHRREPDYDNAKYWFRRVGAHPIFPELNRAAQQIVASVEDTPWDQIRRQGSWDPMHFVDCCSRAARQDHGAEQFCRRIAQAEWELLFDYCYRGVCGKLQD